MKILSIIALLLAPPALAGPSVEVMHFWTSGGEAAAPGPVRDMVVAEGVTWTDAPVAGVGGGTAVPTFAGTHAANAAVVGAATDAITAFFNSDMPAAAGATLLADAIAAAQ